MMEVNYPMVYAVKPILSLNWKDYGVILGYAVINSYLISEIKRYNNDGTYRMIYEIVYSWRENGMENIIPQFNINGATDSDYVDIVFDSLEEARNYRMICNNMLLKDNIGTYGISKVDYIKTSMKSNFDYVLKLEEEHLLKTEVKSKLI